MHDCSLTNTGPRVGQTEARWFTGEVHPRIREASKRFVVIFMTSREVEIVMDTQEIISTLQKINKDNSIMVEVVCKEVDGSVKTDFYPIKRISHFENTIFIVCED